MNRRELDAAADAMYDQIGAQIFREEFRDWWFSQFGEQQWEYGHAYPLTDGWERGDRYGEHRYVKPVSEREARAHKPSGHNSEGEPYWNYLVVRRRRASDWEKVDENE